MSQPDDLLKTLTSQWQASGSELDALVRSLRQRLQWQRWWSTGSLVFELLLSVAALAYAMLSTRNVAAFPRITLAMFIVITLGLSVWARRGRNVGDMETVSGMIELTISRAHKTLRYINAQYFICAASVLFVALMLLHASFRPPPTPAQWQLKLWLISGGLIYLVAWVAGFWLYGLAVQRKLERFQRLRRALQENPLDV